MVRIQVLPILFTREMSVSGLTQTAPAIAKKVPGAYSELVDYTYTMCWIAAHMHRLRMKVGLFGYSESRKIATHLYWQELAKLFRGENDMLISISRRVSTAC